MSGDVVSLFAKFFPDLVKQLKHPVDFWKKVANNSFSSEELLRSILDQMSLYVDYEQVTTFKAELALLMLRGAGLLPIPEKEQQTSDQPSILRLLLAWAAGIVVGLLILRTLPMPDVMRTVAAVAATAVISTGMLKIRTR